MENQSPGSLCELEGSRQASERVEGPCDGEFPGASLCLIDPRPATGTGASSLETPGVTDQNKETKKAGENEITHTLLACWWAHKMVQPVWKRA